MCETDETQTRKGRVRKASQERREQNKAELREQILEVAGEVFLERGYEHFSMRQVAERIGYSATTIYNYFENKDDLLFAVVDLGFERFSAELQAAADSGADPRDKLDAIGEAYVRFGLENPMHYELMFMRKTEFLLASRKGESQPRILAFTALQQAVQEAVDAGVLPPGDVLDYSAFLWANVHGIVSMTIAMPHFTQDFARRAMNALHRLLRREVEAG